MTDTEKINELQQGISVYRETLTSTAKQRDKITDKFNTLGKLFNHFYAQYHLTRRAMISLRLDKAELEEMLSTLQSRDKPPDIEIV